MAQASAEVLPEWGRGAGVVGGEEQGEHEDQARDAGWTDEDAQEKGETDGEFRISDEEGDWRRVGKNEIAQNRGHERVSAAFGEELVDPELKAAVQSELRGEDFVLRENQEECTYADAEKGQGSGVPGIRGERHAGIIMKRRKRA